MLLFKIIILVLLLLFMFGRPQGSELAPERKLDEAIREIHVVMSDKTLDNATKERRIKLIADRLFEKPLIEKHSRDIEMLDEKIAIEVAGKLPWTAGCVCVFREIRIWESEKTSRLYGIIFRFRRQNGEWKVYKLSQQ